MRVKTFLVTLNVALLCCPPAIVWGIPTCGGVAGTGPDVGSGNPCTLSEAPKLTPTIDGDPSDWAGVTDKVFVSWAMDENGTQIGTPLNIDVRYAWDDDNLYFLIEERGGAELDDDPTGGETAANWCGDCDDPGGAAPWSTDSIGFYDENGQPDSTTLPTTIQETGPYTHIWVGLMTAADIAAAGDNPGSPVGTGSGDPRHMTRVVDTSLSPNSGNSGQLIGPGSVSNPGHTPLMPNITGPTTNVQSAFADTTASGGGRIVEFYMEWDQIRYDDNNPTGDPDLAARLSTVGSELDGHYRDDVTEGYEFRMEPLLLDNDGSYGWGDQSFPNGSNGTARTSIEEMSVVRLVAAPSVPGDWDGDGDVDGKDFVEWQREDPSQIPIWEANYGTTAAGAVAGAVVPEPATLVLLTLLGASTMLTRRRRKARPLSVSNVPAD